MKEVNLKLEEWVVEWHGQKAGRNGRTLENELRQVITASAKRKNSQRATVSLIMIVRNEEQNLPRCLESVRGLFDETIVVDTGSTDRTKEIAEAFGARVIEFAWIDDFAAARNVALANATGDYVLWLDADDVIEPPHQEKLKDLLSQLKPDRRTAYVLRCVCDTVDGGKLAVDHPRLFPRLDEVRWEYRVHEQIIPSLLKAQIAMQWTDIIVRHTGYADPIVHEQKRQRNLHLLHRELAERPNDPFVLYYLGTLAFERKQWPEALGYYILSHAKWGNTQSIARKLFAMIAWTNQILTRYDESLRVSNEGLTLFPDDGELWFRKAIAHRYRGETAEAEKAWQRILSLGPPQTFYSVDPGIFGHLTRRNLAIIAGERGDKAGAEAHWRTVLVECPGDPDASRALMPTE